MKYTQFMAVFFFGWSVQIANDLAVPIRQGRHDWMDVGFFAALAVIFALISLKRKRVTA